MVYVRAKAAVVLSGQQSGSKMGNELGSCACGQKEKPDVPTEKKPLEKTDQPGAKDEHSGKKRKKLFSKKRKKKKKDKNETNIEDEAPGLSPPATPTNPNVKSMIRVDVTRELGDPFIVSPSSVSPSRTARFQDNPVTDTFENSPRGARRKLYPSAVTHPGAPKQIKTPNKTKQTDFGPEVITQSGKLPSEGAGDEIEMKIPTIIIHEDTTNIPDKTRLRLDTQDEGAKLSDDAKSKVQHALGGQESWLQLDSVVREQYDIVYVAPHQSEPAPLRLDEIIVVVQREVQKIYVIINPNMITMRQSPQCKNRIYHYYFCCASYLIYHLAGMFFFQLQRIFHLSCMS